MSATGEPTPGLAHGRATEFDPSVDWRKVWSGAPDRARAAADSLLASGIAVRLTTGRGWCGSTLGASDTDLHVPRADEATAQAQLAERFPRERGRGVRRVILRMVMPWRRW